MLCQLDQNLIQTGIPQFLRRIAKGTHTGKQNVVSISQNSRVGGDQNFCTDGSKRTFSGKQISNAIVNNGNHLQHTLCGRNFIFTGRIDGNGFSQGTSHGLESSFDNMVGIGAR